MGCDIHPAVEVRRKGVWRYHRPTEPCKWYIQTYDTQAQVDETNAREDQFYRDNPKIKRKNPPVKLGDHQYRWDKCKTRLPDFFTERDYLKFAILGNVRNDYGYGTVKSFDPLPSMSDCRGFPSDISDEAMAKMSREHSETWVSLADMMAYDFSGDLIHEGVISETEFLACLINGTTPDGWSGGISGPDIEVKTPEQYLALFGAQESLWRGIKGVPRTYDTTKRYYVQYRWAVPLNTACPAIPDIITYLHDLIPKGGTAEDVRLVMDFDS